MTALWPHQSDAVAAATDRLRAGGRATVIMACGTGKTRVGSETAQRLGAARVLVAVPTLELLAQTVHAYRLEHGDQALGRIIAVCSDQTITRRHEIDLRAEHADVTTDSEQLHELCSGKGRRTVFSTYASLPTAVAGAHRDQGLPPWDLAVVDEAHRTVGDHGRAWAAIHDDDRIPARRRLYFTATPRVIAESGTSLQVASMDDETTFGAVVHQLLFADAIDLGYLADYRVVVSVVAEPEVRDLIRHHPYLTVGGRAIDSATVAAHVALLRAADQYGLRRVISFHNRVSRAGHFAATLSHTALAMGRNPDRLWATHLSAVHPPPRRRQVLDQLRGDDERLMVVANARVLAEGIDVPAVDGIVFADPRGSTIDAIQAVGRALRRGSQPGKTATILIPVLAAPGHDPDLLDSRSPYAAVWEVLRALRAHDSRAGAAFDQLHQRLRHRRPAESAPALPGWLRADGLPLPESFLTAITVATVDVDGTFEQQWLRNMAAAEAYYEQHGHLRVPQRWTTVDGLPLGAWINTQRVARSRGALPEHRIAALDVVGMVWDARDDQWATGYAAAERYAAEHGHLHPPAAYATPSGFRLGWWVTNLRMRASDLSPARAEALRHLDPDWNPPWDRHWQRGLINARRFRAEHGHLDVASSYRAPNGHRLGEWIHRQRRIQARLTPQQRAALTRLGMTWDQPPLRDQMWQRGIAAATAFHVDHGHLRVPRDYTTANGFRLGLWIENVRRRRDKVPAQRRAVLEQLGISPNTVARGHQESPDLAPTFLSQR
ncbi:Helicase associated domain protein (plasmid) [Micromonospora zamorensis]|uniref:DEAD/DEAH box helicase n=1 Tax=Micromonospora zamorensis TaxID=709883 RepID=UPI002E24EDDA